MSNTDETFNDWQHREELAETMIPIIGKLYREKDVTILVHSRSLVSKSDISILKAHRFARQIEGEELSVTDTFPLLQAVAKLDLGPSKIDLGLLAVQYAEDDRGLSVDEFVAEKLSGATGENKLDRNGGQDVVLYGFGRIGRLVARLLVEKAGSRHGLRLKAVVVRKGGEDDLIKRASLLRRDSIHGQFAGTITVDEKNGVIVANGNPIQFIYSNDPASVDYTAYGINDAILIDNTGKWRGVLVGVQADGDVQLGCAVRGLAAQLVPEREGVDGVHEPSGTFHSNLARSAAPCAGRSSASARATTWWVTSASASFV